jgi:hypothetical protein
MKWRKKIISTFIRSYVRPPPAVRIFWIAATSPDCAPPMATVAVA